MPGNRWQYSASPYPRPGRITSQQQLPSRVHRCQTWLLPTTAAGLSRCPQGPSPGCKTPLSLTACWKPGLCHSYPGHSSLPVPREPRSHPAAIHGNSGWGCCQGNTVRTASVRLEAVLIRKIRLIKAIQFASCFSFVVLSCPRLAVGQTGCLDGACLCSPWGFARERKK